MVMDELYYFFRDKFFLNSSFLNNKFLESINIKQFQIKSKNFLNRIIYEQKI